MSLSGAATGGGELTEGLILLGRLLAAERAFRQAMQVEIMMGDFFVILGLG